MARYGVKLQMQGQICDLRCKWSREVRAGWRDGMTHRSLSWVADDKACTDSRAFGRGELTAEAVFLGHIRTQRQTWINMSLGVIGEKIYVESRGPIEPWHCTHRLSLPLHSEQGVALIVSRATPPNLPNQLLPVVWVFSNTALFTRPAASGHVSILQHRPTYLVSCFRSCEYSPKVKSVARSSYL